jgi:hypothetical protein
MNFQQYKKTKERVEKYLIDKPHLRDDDFRLIANYWMSEITTDKLKDLTGYELLKMFAEKKLTHPESIRRSRQKLQEMNPDLRGKSYKSRKKEEQEFTRNLNK